MKNLNHILGFIFSAFFPVVMASLIFIVAKAFTLDYRYRRHEARWLLIVGACFYCILTDAVIAIILSLASESSIMFGVEIFVFMLIASLYGVLRGFKGMPELMPESDKEEHPY